MKIILSIDGGGMRGIIPALVLDHLERQLDMRACRLFDLIAGTSTGGILALALAGSPPLHALELVDLYEQEGRFIFGRSFWKGTASLGGLVDEKYSHGPLEEVLRRYLGPAFLDEATTKVMVSAYDIERRQPYFFKSWTSPTKEPHRVQMVHAARATSAAPTYFEPARVLAGNKRTAFIDGGVCVNNPAMCAYAEARLLWPEEDIHVVSLGTGELTRPIPYEEACSWGLVGWAIPLLNVIFDGQSDAVDYQLRQILAGHYYRLQGRLDIARDDMDDASMAQVQALRTEAERIMYHHEGDLAQICELLRRRKEEV